MTLNTTRLRELLDKATHTPWATKDCPAYAIDAGSRHIAMVSCWREGPADDSQNEANAALIAEGINALPALLDELERLAERDGKRGSLVQRQGAEITRLMAEIESKDAEVKRLREALTELVACKDLKERIAVEQETMIPETDDELEALDRLMSDYAARRPKAWEAARAALSDPTTNEGA